MHIEQSRDKYTFEVKTPRRESFYLTVNEDTPMYEVYNLVMDYIEYNTILMKSSVVDMFMIYGDTCISIRDFKLNAGMFIEQYISNFTDDKQVYDNGAYCIYIMDELYINQRSTGNQLPVYANDVVPPPIYDKENIIKNLLDKTISFVTGTYI